ncbi:hypothetical protein WN943_013504 [Citrus x changshan-huyou]
MASTEGFLTEEQRETLKIATQNAEVLSSSPKSPTSLLSEHYLKVPAGGKAPNVGIAVRHVRRSHSGKLVRVKKGEFSTYMQFFYMVWNFMIASSENLLSCDTEKPYGDGFRDLEHSGMERGEFLILVGRLLRLKLGHHFML